MNISKGQRCLSLSLFDRNNQLFKKVLKNDRGRNILKHSWILSQMRDRVITPGQNPNPWHAGLCRSAFSGTDLIYNILSRL